MKLFTGLESESEAAVRLSHFSIGREVEDMRLSCELENGNTITTSAQATLTHIHIYIGHYQTKMEYIQ